MPTISIACGAILLLIGIIGYVSGVMNDRASMTAMIPALFGIILIAAGVLAGKFENSRKHIMHAAVVVALLGFLATAGRLVSKFSELNFSAAVISQIATAIVCLIFVVLAIKSFGDARRARQSI